MEKLEIVVSSSKDGKFSDLTVGELGTALVFTNRLANRIFTERYHDQELSALNAEPSAVSLRITELRKGSAFIQAVIEHASDPDVRALAIGIGGNLLTPLVRSSIRSISRNMARLSKAAAGKTITIVIRLGNSSVRIDTTYPPNGKPSTRIYDDTQ